MKHLITLLLLFFVGSQSAALDNNEVNGNTKKSSLTNFKTFINFTGTGMAFEGEGKHSNMQEAGKCLVYIGNVKTNYTNSEFHARVTYGSYDRRYIWFAGASTGRIEENSYMLKLADSNPDGLLFPAVLETITISKNNNSEIISIKSRNRLLWEIFELNCEGLRPISLQEYIQLTNDYDLVN